MNVEEKLHLGASHACLDDGNCFVLLGCKLLELLRLLSHLCHTES